VNNFDYHRPSKLSEVTALLTALPDARPLAGGMTLIPALKQHLASPPALVDLGSIGELRGIRASDTVVTIGAMTRHCEVARSAEIRRLIPALTGLADSIGDPQVRNCGTLGGSIANNDPAADYPAAVLALAATITTTSRNLRKEILLLLKRVSDEGGNLWALVGHCRRHASLLPVPVVQRLSRPAKKPESVEAHDAKFLGIRILGYFWQLHR